jgi:hypothetical protein
MELLKIEYKIIYGNDMIHIGKSTNLILKG